MVVAAVETVITGAGGDPVVAGAVVDPVAARACLDPVLSSATSEHVALVATDENVGTVAAAERDGACASVEERRLPASAARSSLFTTSRIPCSKEVRNMRKALKYRDDRLPSNASGSQISAIFPCFRSGSGNSGAGFAPDCLRYHAVARVPRLWGCLGEVTICQRLMG